MLYDFKPADSVEYVVYVNLKIYALVHSNKWNTVFLNNASLFLLRVTRILFILYCKILRTELKIALSSI